MNMKITVQSLFIALTISTTFPVMSETLKDPRTRDEDISMTEITVKVDRLDNGFYEYLYSMTAPLENKGEIASLSLDLYCENPNPASPFPEPKDKYFNTKHAEHGKYVPVQIYHVPGKAGAPTVSGTLGIWAFGDGAPGFSVENMRILSEAPPGKRKYVIRPYLSTEGWDYTDDSELDPTIPWIPDFTVTGTTLGPACPGEEYEFPGSNAWNKEPPEVNELLTYLDPTVDQFHVDRGTSTVNMHIHYAENIDPKSFKVEPGYLRRFFDPQPGTYQTLALPIKKNIHQLRVKLEVRANRTAKGKDKKAIDKQKDKDVFVIRVDR